MNKSTQASKPGDWGRCSICRNDLIPGERGQECSELTCHPGRGVCSECLVECECGKLICEEHRYEVSGLVLCKECARLELDADDLMEREAPACTDCGQTRGSLLFREYEAGTEWSGLECCE